MDTATHKLRVINRGGIICSAVRSIVGSTDAKGWPTRRMGKSLAERHSKPCVPSIVVQLRMFKKTGFRVLIVLIAVISILASLNVYYIRTQAGGELFWSANEAYIFLRVTQTGYRLSYIKYPLNLAEEALGGVTQPDDRHSSVLVIRATRDGVQRYVADNFRLGGVEPFEGVLYAGNLLNSEPPMKWTGTQFERADPDELKRYYTNANKWPSGPSYDNVAGWSKRTAAGEVLRESPTDYT